jgi:preprotein translocase subunit SecE
MDFNIKKLFEYLGDVKQEADKVTWPSKEDVIITTIVVILLACVCAIFFAIVDTTCYRTVRWLI